MFDSSYHHPCSVLARARRVHLSFPGPDAVGSQRTAVSENQSWPWTAELDVRRPPRERKVHDKQFAMFDEYLSMYRK